MIVLVMKSVLIGGGLDGDKMCVIGNAAAWPPEVWMLPASLGRAA